MRPTNVFKKEKITYIVLSLILIAVGAYLIVNPELSFELICTIIGVILIVYGIIRIAGYFMKDMYQLAFQFDFAMGIFTIIIGLLFVFHSEHIMKLFPIIVGLAVLIDGVFKIQTALDAKMFGLRKWWLILVLATIAVIAGFLLIIKPISAARLLMRLIGLNLIIDGGLNLWMGIYTVKDIKVYNK